MVFSLFGNEASWEYKRLTKLADSSIFAKWGGTAINVSILRGEGDPATDFLPLTVEYIERYYAAGRISDSPYVKREGRPSDAAVLKARIIDRAIRPRFPKQLRDQIQVFVNVLSYDPDYDPLILALNTVPAALMASSIPFNGPLAGMRVGMQADKVQIQNKVANLWDLAGHHKGELVLMDFVLAVDENGLVMVDGFFNQTQEEKVLEAVDVARQSSNEIFNAQQEFAQTYGVEKYDGAMIVVPSELQEKVQAYEPAILEAFAKPDKLQKVEALDKLEHEILCRFVEEYDKKCDVQLQDKQTQQDESEKQYTMGQVRMALENTFKNIVQKIVLEQGKRLDGRAFDQIRDLKFEVGLLPRVHGSALFSRGDTVVLSTVTLGSLMSKLHVEEMYGVQERRYIHEYYAAPYSYGEPGRYRYYPGRREVGHGALAEKALFPVLPSQESFPYMIRVVSEVMSSSGSTSMASVTGSSMALMDAGVPIKEPVTGISIGIVADKGFTRHQLLTDIVGFEDFWGGMDFKVAGTRTGITAIQMDQKYGYIPFEYIPDILERAKQARLFILDKMSTVIGKPKAQVSQWAPKIEQVNIPADSIGLVIGTGGRVIKDIMEKTDTTIHIEENGTVTITGMDQDKLGQAKKMISDIAAGSDNRQPEHNYKVGDVVKIQVQELKPFGAIVKLDDTNVTALLHISEIADKYIKDISQVLSVGQILDAKIIEIDDRGRIRVSIKRLNKSD